MRRALLLVYAMTLGIACGDNASRPPLPWTSGDRIKAEVFRADGLIALAGRWDPMFGFECDVNDRNPPALLNCPQTARELVYSDPNCTRRDLATRAAFTVATVSVGDEPHYFDVATPSTTTTVYKLRGSCVPESAHVHQPLRVAIPIEAELLQLGEPVEHTFDDVVYTAIETSDGFTMITSVSDATEVISNSMARLRVRWAQNGSVRMYRGLYDNTFKANCIAAYDPSGAIRCVPDKIPSVAFESSSCVGPTIPIAFEQGFYTHFGNRLGRPAVQSVWTCQSGTTRAYQPLPNHQCGQIPNALSCSEVSLESLPRLSLELE